MAKTNEQIAREIVGNAISPAAEAMRCRFIAALDAKDERVRKLEAAIDMARRMMDEGDYADAYDHLGTARRGEG